jgi:xylan 1,4-beta-xylosidase
VLTSSPGPGARTICNPVNFPYPYQNIQTGQSHSLNREGADPSIVLFRDRFYLFLSMSGGFWHSDDLLNWSFVSTPSLPYYDYAPDIREVDGALVMCASHRTEPCNFYRTTNPLAGSWEEIPGSLAFWDPNLFQDDDGKLYLYWGCSNRTPIWGVELDRTTFQPLHEQLALINSDVAQRGWERRDTSNIPKEKPEEGSSNYWAYILGDAPFIEGAWMTKYEGLYYLQYSAPATEDNTYADGYYIGTGPLGPFTYSPHSPFSSKPGGFMPAAGHGSTFQDRHGNWWHTSTMRISKNHAFERRIGIFPAGFDKDGALFCNQEFADYPMAIPDGPADPWSLSAQWMLLSYRCPVLASSSAPEHPAELAVDEDCTTWWVAADSEAGHWLQLELVGDALVHAIQVNFADHYLQAPEIDEESRHRSNIGSRYIDPMNQPVEYLLEGSVDGTAWIPLTNTSGAGRSPAHDYLILDQPTTYKFVRLTAFAQPYGGSVAISGLRVFGRGAGQPPAQAVSKSVRTGPLDARVDWEAVPAAQGYNIRYGLAPDKLYSSWLVYGATHLDLSTLNAGHDYWVAVDAFNENGINRGVPLAVQAND